MRKRLNTSVYTFKKIISENGMYVDKTRELYQMVSKFNGQYFLSRPRRFGKSLTISTLESIFFGEKELFKGLYIDNKEYDWKKYPVIRLAMNKVSSTSFEELDKKLSYSLEDIAEDFKLEIPRDGASEKFRQLIQKVYKNYGQVVVLIDEYDKPILDNILDQKEVLKIKTLLKQFYGMIKACEEYLRFTFITGVSKFTQVSIFSDLNNLTDITLHPDFSTICGFTQKEGEHYFSEWIDENCKKLNMTRKEYLTKIKENYNGIRFSENEIYVYNPVSFTRAMDECSFKHYWFETGTPTFLLTLLKKKNYPVIDCEALKLRSSGFSSFEVDNLEVEPILYQTGYLTIKDYDEESQVYTLSYPNKEVKQAFIERLVDYFTPARSIKAPALIEDLREAFLLNDMDKAFRVIKVFYAKIDNSIKIKQEKYYQTVFYILFTLLGYRINAEVNTNDGRMDAVIETDNHIYIFEFKLNNTAKEAIEQIKEKEYFNRYLLDKRQLNLIGIQFDGKNGSLKEWLMMEYNKT